MASDAASIDRLLSLSHASLVGRNGDTILYRPSPRTSPLFRSKSNWLYTPFNIYLCVPPYTGYGTEVEYVPPKITTYGSVRFDQKI